MRNPATVWQSVVLILVVSCARYPSSVIADEPRLAELIEQGAFAEAEAMLRAEIPDLDAPVTSDAAIQLEILRRTRYDFALTGDEVLEQIQKSIADVTAADVDRWREAGDLQARVIDGELPLLPTRRLESVSF